MPERRSLIPRFRTQPRVFEYSIGHIYAVGGLTKNGLFILQQIISKIFYLECVELN